jgi:hypothetical protein
MKYFFGEDLDKLEEGPVADCCVYCNELSGTFKGVEECLDKASYCMFDIDDCFVKLVVLNSVCWQSENILGHLGIRIWN